MTGGSLVNFSKTDHACELDAVTIIEFCCRSDLDYTFTSSASSNHENRIHELTKINIALEINMSSPTVNVFTNILSPLFSG